MGAIGNTRETCIVVIDGKEGQVGIIVDAVSEVIELNAEQIEPAPSLGDDAGLSFLLGMGKIDNRVIILIDIVEALSKDNLHMYADMEKMAA